MDQQDCPLLKKQLTCKGKDFIVLPITCLLMEASYLNNSLLSLCCTRTMCKINEDWVVEYCSTFSERTKVTYEEPPAWKKQREELHLDVSEGKRQL